LLPGKYFPLLKGFLSTIYCICDELIFKKLINVFPFAAAPYAANFLLLFFSLFKNFKKNFFY
jgi:hypothetical protein